MVMISFPVMIEIDYILHLWLGENVPDGTAIFTILVILNMLVTNFNPPVSQVVHATGNMRKYQVITSVILTTILPISWVALHFGTSAVSVFWISLFVAIVNQGICLIVLRGIFNYSIRAYIRKVIIPCTIVSVTVLPIPFFLHSFLEAGVTRLILVLITNTIASFAFIYFVGLTYSERLLTKEIITKNTKRKS